MTSFGENLRAARKMRGWSLQDLADRVGGITKQALNKYEQGTMKPEGSVLGLLAQVLDVSPNYFFRTNRLELGPVEFRKKARLTVKETDSIKEKIRDYLERYIEVEGMLGVEHQFDSPFKDAAGKARKRRVTNAQEIEDAAEATLKEWRLGINPIPNVVETLEEHGVCVLVLDTSSSFQGLATFVSELPVIVLNGTDTPERRRFTALHELGHSVLDIIADTEKELEVLCHRFAGAMLLPQEVIWREFGHTRKRISDYELIAVKNQYGISAQAIMRRLWDLNVISDSYYKHFCFKMGPNWMEKDFGQFLGERKKSYRFQQLIRRLVAEDIVSDAKAASLAGVTLQEFRSKDLPTDE